ncbi:MAG: serine hydrolase domain-containing protein [Massilia sp.]
MMLSWASALAAPPPNFATRAEALRQRICNLGLAITIVGHGGTTPARGFGVRKFGAPVAVDSDALFRIGSTGKGITVAALATLADAGKVGCVGRQGDGTFAGLSDVRSTGYVRAHDPRPAHPSQREEIRSGRPAVRSAHESRAETVRRVLYRRLATSLRSTYACSNLMHLVAGALTEPVSSMPWETYVREHVLRPAGMTVSTTDTRR